MKNSGIYKIQSIIKPERSYVGSAVDLKDRWRVHLCLLRKNKHHSLKLQNHFNKYGVDDLVFIILEPCLPQFLTIRENYYIKSMKPYFNICKVAGSSLGRVVTEETRKKISDSMKGIVSWNKGKTPSEETRKKISEANKGRKASEETKRKISEGHKGLGQWMKGRLHSEEWKQNMREITIRNGNKPPSPLGLKRSDETKMKMSNNLIGNKRSLGHKHSEESLKKMRIPKSEETKQKMRASWISRNKNKVA